MSDHNNVIQDVNNFIESRKTALLNGKELERLTEDQQLNPDSEVSLLATPIQKYIEEMFTETLNPELTRVLSGHVTPYIINHIQNVMEQEDLNFDQYRAVIAQRNSQIDEPSNVDDLCDFLLGNHVSQIGLYRAKASEVQIPVEDTFTNADTIIEDINQYLMNPEAEKKLIQLQERHSVEEIRERANIAMTLESIALEEDLQLGSFALFQDIFLDHNIMIETVENIQNPTIEKEVKGQDMEQENNNEVTIEHTQTGNIGVSFSSAMSTPEGQEMPEDVKADTVNLYHESSSIGPINPYNFDISELSDDVVTIEPTALNVLSNEAREELENPPLVQINPLDLITPEQRLVQLPDQNDINQEPVIIDGESELIDAEVSALDKKPEEPQQAGSDNIPPIAADPADRKQATPPPQGPKKPKGKSKWKRTVSTITLVAAVVGATIFSLNMTDKNDASVNNTATGPEAATTANTTGPEAITEDTVLTADANQEQFQPTAPAVDASANNSSATTGPAESSSSTDNTTTVTAEEAVTVAPQTIPYMIMPGDTLSELAEKFNTDVKTLKELNNIADADIHDIKAFHMLDVPQSEENQEISNEIQFNHIVSNSVADNEEVISYTTKQGDNLHNIAQQFNVDLNKVVALNTDIDNPALIQPSQEILIPVAAESTVQTVEIDSIYNQEHYVYEELTVSFNGEALDVGQAVYNVPDAPVQVKNNWGKPKNI